jgi:hypothetical protein
MWFTLIMFGGPIALMFLDRATPGSDGFGLLAGFWLLASIPMVGLYWLTRVMRKAWRHGDPTIPRA